MAEKTTKSTAKKSSTKPKSTGKRLSVTIDPDTMAQLNEYLAQFGLQQRRICEKSHSGKNQSGQDQRHDRQYDSITAKKDTQSGACS